MAVILGISRQAGKILRKDSMPEGFVGTFSLPRTTLISESSTFQWGLTYQTIYSNFALTSLNKCAYWVIRLSTW